MALKSMMKMSSAGHETVCEWDTETVTPDRLQEIEREFQQRLKEGWFAADVTDKRDVIIHEFYPTADILLIPRVQGGTHGSDH